eukprot:11091281-Ditylum_brightwellii.AAC.1
MGHLQPPTPMHSDNSIAVGIANKTIKPQQSRAMNMQYFWMLDQVQQKNFDVGWTPGQEHLADYPTKHHAGKLYQHVSPFYVHTADSPRYLPRAQAPHILQGCAKSPGIDKMDVQWTNNLVTDE